MTLRANIWRSGVVPRDGHDNFFTPLRLIFALMVVFGHAFIIGRGGPEFEPRILFGYTPSYLAVNLFFIASGFLVTASMLHRRDGRDFAAARLLRIYPALIVHVAVLMFIVGPLATALPLHTYLSDPGLWLEPLRILSFVDTDVLLPGTFEANAEAYASAPLWTLRFEMLCYIGTLLAFSVGLMRKRWMILAQFGIVATLWIAAPHLSWFDALPNSAKPLLRFGLAYSLGAALYAYRDHLRLTVSVPLLLLGLCVLLRHTVLLEPVLNLLLGSVVLLIAYVRLPRLTGLQTMADMSYGLYIYHWAVMQLIVHWQPEIGVAGLLATALPITTALAWLSWTYVEKPMLRHKAKVGRWLRFGKTRPADQNPILVD